ncbi:aminoacyl tRNA synthase complex-interacting multifunctional protein 2-like [Sycon ciliatum]|uniref:aminoacyl tRNA synthase complex-interacting multifunctional protein 2-like n=1 Tax=Sycon ciliatum TaxID=27933 RepID=UPI0020ABA880|eukprot:scpid87963/ scgid12945/ Aminoacyl tRNA synthase complex-interacting multifunctional protein 2; Multisynthase complex auxiliary component p38; Protein JTV-1
MASTGTMYSIPPSAPIDGKMDLPSCMYRMPPLQGGPCGAEQSSSQASTSAEASSSASLASLEQRQVAVIADLEELQVQVDSLALRLNVAIPPLPGTSSDQQIVVHASPNNPPTAVLYLLRALAHKLPVTTAVYLHSSLKSLSTELQQFLRTVVPNRSSAEALRLVVVWREIADDESYIMVRSHGAGAAQCCVRGQQNIGRYLCRKYLYRLYEALGAMATLEIDAAISSFYLPLLASSQTNNKEQAAALKQANVALGRNAFLAGENVSLADLLLYSVVSRKPALVTANNVKAWVKRLATNPITAPVAL